MKGDAAMFRALVTNPPWPGDGYGARSSVRWPHKRKDKKLEYPIFLSYAVALAILFDRLGDKERAIALSEPFMKAVVANLDNDWVLTGDAVDAFLRQSHAT